MRSAKTQTGTEKTKTKLVSLVMLVDLVLLAVGRHTLVGSRSEVRQRTAKGWCTNPTATLS